MWSRSWRIDDMLDELRIEILPPSSPPHAGDRPDRARTEKALSEREMRTLLWRARHEPSVRRLLREVHFELDQFLIHAPSNEEDDLEPSIGDALSFAAFSGQLRIVRMPTRARWIPIAPDTEREIESPLSEPVETWFELRVIDEVGEPLSGVELSLRVGGRIEKKVTDGDGKTRVDGEAGVCSVNWADEDAVRETLRARWSSPRGADWYSADEAAMAQHTFVSVRRNEALPTVALFSEEPHSIVLQPRVVQANLKGMWFATSKCFLLPSARHGLGGIKELYDTNQDTDLLIVGHTDRAGAPPYNDRLSLERAEAIAAYLTNDVDAWMAWYRAEKSHEKRWGNVEDEQMILALAEESGETIPEDQTPMSWYQSTRGLSGDGKPTDASRRALVREYMDLDGTTLAEGIVLMTHGCGESFPIAPTADGEAEIENRRVELFFFENVIRPPGRPSAVLPPPPRKNSAPSSTEYPEWTRRVNERSDFEAGAWIRLLMKYEDESVASNVTFRIRYDDDTEIETLTSEAGVLMVHARKDLGWSIMGIEDESIITSFT